MTPATPAEVKADVLAVAAGGPLLEALDARFGGRLARAAQDADPLATVYADTDGELDYALAYARSNADIIEVEP